MLTKENYMSQHPLLELRNRTQTKLRAGKTTIGLFLISGNAMIAETLGTLPIDWLIIDMEASPVSNEGALHIMQALNGSEVTPMIRVSTLDHHLIEHALDLGAHGVLIPKIDTPEQAAEAVEACRYPPKGRRGINPVRASAYFGNLPSYFQGANERTLCMVQIESVNALRRVNEIAAVRGVDVLFIGAGDLASSFGQPGVVTGEKMDMARQQLLTATKILGTIPGIFAYSTDLAIQYAKEGFKFIAIGNDIKALRESVADSIQRLGFERTPMHRSE
jgi:2-keto-3-deoxy-L-rhamnonate aldolase RhmA